jgi:hypothetical protein
MVIDVLASVELLRQAGVAPARMDLAESFILRRSIEGEAMAHRIQQNAVGRIDRDARVLSLVEASAT